MKRLYRFLRRKPKLYIVLSLLSLLNIVYPHPAAAALAPQSDSATQPIQAVVDAATQHAAIVVLPVIPVVPAKRTVFVTATAYTSSVSECDSDPFTTASGAKTADGVIAANGYPFGTKVRIPDYFGDKVFIVLDRMGRGGKNRIDIWMHTKHEALDWGVRRVRMEIL
ncbi:MAG: 3D domain-containing protein [Candidatus Kerfeldbacteria bacterium]